MQIFPAIDLRGGQVVRLYQGDYDKETVYAQDPCAVARDFIAAGAGYLHVVDLDGAKDGTLANFDTIAAIAGQGGLYIEVGGGIRDEDRIRRYLDLGVGRCILGTIAVKDFDFTERMAQTYGDPDRRGGGRPGRLRGRQRLEGAVCGKGRGLLPPPPGRGRPDRHLYGHQPGWGGTGHQSGALPGAGKN